MTTKPILLLLTIVIGVFFAHCKKLSPSKPLADTKSALAGLFSLSMYSVEQVHQVVDNGLKAGGIEPAEFKDYGFTQQRTIEDMDSHP